MRRISSMLKIRLILILVILTSYQMIFIQNGFSTGESIIVTGADGVIEIDQVGSNNLTSIASEVDDRIIINYADSVIEFDSEYSNNLGSKANEVDDRIIVNYADSIIDFDSTRSNNLTSIADEVDDRIIINYADSSHDFDLIEPTTIQQLFEGPSILINSLDGSYFSSPPPLMDVDFTDVTGLDDAYYKVDSYSPGGTDTTGWTAIFTDHSGTTFTTDFTMDNSIWSSLSEGLHTVYFKAWDDSGYVVDGASHSWQFFKDSIFPIISINNLNGTPHNLAPTLDVDFSDSSGLDSAYYRVDSYSPTGLDTTGWIEIFSSYAGTSYTTDFTMDNSVWSSLSEGSHTVYFKAWDDLGNINDGPFPSWNFNIDFSEPDITLNMQNSSYYNAPPSFDVDFSDPGGLDSAYYKIDSYTPTGPDTTGWIEIFSSYAGTSYTTDFTMDDSIWASLSEGSHIVYFKAWDDLGNTNDGSVPNWQFNIDKTAPNIIINSPNWQFFSSPPILNVTFEDNYDLKSAYYKIDSYTPLGIDITGWSQIFINISEKIHTTDIIIPNNTWNSIEDGFYTLYIKCWDDLDNVNDGPTPNWKFFKYSGTPIIKINTPQGNYYNASPIMDIDFFDPTKLNDAYYKVDSYNPLGINTTEWTQIFSDQNSINYTDNFIMDNNIWLNLNEGIHVLYIKVWNNTGSINDGPDPFWQFYKDTIPPEISLLTPAQNGIYQSSVSITISITGHTSCYYGWDNSPYTLTNSTIFTLPTIDGEHILHLKAKDEVGNIELASFTFITDNTPPSAEVVGMRDNLHISSLITIRVTPYDDNGINHISFYLGSQLLSQQTSDYIYRFDPTMYSYGTYIFIIEIEDLAGNILSRDFTIYIEEPQKNLWQDLMERGILIPVVGAIFAGFVGIIFFYVKRKLKKDSF